MRRALRNTRFTAAARADLRRSWPALKRRRASGRAICAQPTDGRSRSRADALAEGGGSAARPQIDSEERRRPHRRTQVPEASMRRAFLAFAATAVIASAAVAAPGPSGKTAALAAGDWR